MSAVPTVLLERAAHLACAQASAPRVQCRWLCSSTYRWFAVLAMLDVLLTSIILTLGGTESNAIACFMYRTFGVAGLVLLKVPCVLLVIAICERVGRERPALARGVARLAVLLNTVPVAFGLACMSIFASHLVPTVL